MEADLQKELRALDRRVMESIASVRSDLARMSSNLAVLATNEKEIVRLQGEITSLRVHDAEMATTLTDLKMWKAEMNGRMRHERIQGDFWKGIGGKVLGGVLLAVILGAGGTLAAVYQMVSSLPNTGGG